MTVLARIQTWRLQHNTLMGFLQYRFFKGIHWYSCENATILAFLGRKPGRLPFKTQSIKSNLNSEISNYDLVHLNFTGNIENPKQKIFTDNRTDKRLPNLPKELLSWMSQKILRVQKCRSGEHSLKMTLILILFQLFWEDSFISFFLIKACRPK